MMMMTMMMALGVKGGPRAEVVVAVVASGPAVQGPTAAVGMREKGVVVAAETEMDVAAKSGSILVVMGARAAAAAGAGKAAIALLQPVAVVQQAVRTAMPAPLDVMLTPPAVARHRQVLGEWRFHLRNMRQQASPATCQHPAACSQLLREGLTQQHGLLASMEGRRRLCLPRACLQPLPQTPWARHNSWVAPQPRSC